MQHKHMQAVVVFDRRQHRLDCRIELVPDSVIGLCFSVSLQCVQNLCKAAIESGSGHGDQRSQSLGIEG